MNRCCDCGALILNNDEAFICIECGGWNRRFRYANIGNKPLADNFLGKHSTAIIHVMWIWGVLCYLYMMLWG